MIGRLAKGHGSIDGRHRAVQGARSKRKAAQAGFRYQHPLRQVRWRPGVPVP